MKKLISILVAFAMMATLGIAMAFAAPDAEDVSTSLANSKISKTFDVPAGVPTPEAKFGFVVTPVSAPSSVTLTEKTEYITFDGTTTGSQTATKALSSFISLPDSTADFHLSQPGEYVFTVTEETFTAAGVTTAPATGAYYLQDTDTLSTENVAKDGKTYKLRIYVANSTDAQNPGHYVKAITLIDTTKDVADTATDAEKAARDAAKVSPETGFTFTNVYTKKITETTDTVNGAFNVGKTVTGSGDTAYAYPIDVTITIDDATLENGAYTLTGSKSGAWNFDEDTLTLKKTVNLANGEKDVFMTFPAGATVKVEEQTGTMANLQYADKYDGKVDGLVTGNYAGGAKMTSTEAVYTAKSAAAVTNNLKDSEITPTGILISNLPYIALALVAIGGLVAYVVVRRRQSDEA